MAPSTSHVGVASYVASTNDHMTVTVTTRNRAQPTFFSFDVTDVQSNARQS